MVTVTQSGLYLNQRAQCCHTRSHDAAGNLQMSCMNGSSSSDSTVNTLLEANVNNIAIQSTRWVPMDREEQDACLFCS